MSMWAILGDLAAERHRQHEKWGDQSRLPDGTGETEYREQADVVKLICQRKTAAGTVTWADILTEEYYEALAETGPTRLRTELVQLAAVCVQWVEAIDSRDQTEDAA